MSILEAALAGEPVKLRSGAKTYMSILEEVKEQINYDERMEVLRKVGTGRSFASLKLEEAPTVRAEIREEIQKARVKCAELSTELESALTTAIIKKSSLPEETAEVVMQHTWSKNKKLEDLEKVFFELEGLVKDVLKIKKYNHHVCP